MVRKIFFLTEHDKNKLGFKYYNNTVFFLIFKDKKIYKYQKVPYDIYIKKYEENYFFCSNICSYKFLNSYTIQFLNWLRFSQKKVKKKILIKGLGFRCSLSDDKKMIILKIGFSHLIYLNIPTNISSIYIEKTYILIEGDDSNLVGNFAKRIREFKAPDAYKGKGFLYKTEKLFLKPVKKK